MERISRQVLRLRGGKGQWEADELAAEEPLEIRVRGRAISVTMRTPGFDEELAIGFLLTEGVVRSADDVLQITACERNEEGNLINVVLRPEVPVDFEQLTRHVFASSSCGLCGKATIEAIAKRFPRVTSDVTIESKVLAQLPERMRTAQETFDRTGGLHAAALFDERGEMIVLREDIGRHNAVDKVLGFAAMKRLLPLGRHVLLASGRSSFEILQKALAGGIAVVASVSAPSSLAVECAEEYGQTLIGFLRGNGMNVYTHPQRVKHLEGE